MSAARAIRVFTLLGALIGPSAMQVTDAWALKPVRGYPATPGHYGILYQEARFQAPDSIPLVGWFYPAQDTEGIANDLVGRVLPVPENMRRAPRPYPSPDRSRPTIIICDGDGGNMADLIFYAYSLFPRGFHVFTFDWRGFGESGEWPMDPDVLCLPEFLRDYGAAIDYVKTRPEVDPDRIALMGFSTGAYLSFAMLVTRQDITAFVGRALMTSFDDLLANLREIDPNRPWKAPEGYPAECLPVHAAPHVLVPALLVVGEKDQRTPPWMSEKVASLLKGPKSVWIVRGAGHGGPSAPEIQNYPEFFERAAAFLGESMKER